MSSELIPSDAEAELEHQTGSETVLRVVLTLTNWKRSCRTGSPLVRKQFNSAFKAPLTQPSGGDDKSSIKVATVVRQELHRRYGF